MQRNTAITIASKFIILFANLALVLFSTHLWGSAGRGEIALVVANISIIALLGNVFCGSTISYHAPRLELNLLVTVSLAGALVVSFIGAVVFSFLIGFKYFLYLFIISLILSLTTSISSFWLGKSNLVRYNLLTVLLPLLILASLTLLYLFLKQTNPTTYFNAYMAGSGILLAIGLITLFRFRPLSLQVRNIQGIRSILGYGLNNELNSLIQFISYRLSYFLIAKYLDLTRLGVFSVSIAISEAVWVISRSLSAVHYSNVLNSDDNLKSRRETVVLVRQSCLISLVLLLIAVLLPGSVYQFVFGKEFGEIKKFILYLIPGIVAVAGSNLFDQYFSGTGNLKVIRERSLIALGLTLVLMPVLISRYELTGICISMNISYIISALYIWYKFRKEIRPVHL